MHKSQFTRACTAAFPDGSSLLLLAVMAVATGIASSAQSLDVMLVLDTSPGTEQSTDRIRAKSFGESDRVGVVGAVPPVRLLLPLAEDKRKVADTLHRASIRVGSTVGNVSIAQIPPLDLVGAISAACAQLRESPERPNKKAIVVVFAGEDRALPAAVQRLRAQIDGVQARLFAILVTRTPVQPRTATPLGGVPVLLAPVLTTEALADLAKGSGGRIYRQGWDLKDVLKEALR
jgi:hypothetical protein